MTDFAWRGERVLVTGGAGFIGSHLVERLLERGAIVRVVTRTPSRLRALIGDKANQVELSKGDLTDRETATAACKHVRAVFHLAAHVAGVGYNSSHPGGMLASNVNLTGPVLEGAVRTGVERLLCVSSACVYPRHCTVPTPESEGFMGDPEPTNLGYGWAKRIAEVQARCYAQEYPIKIGIARPYNAYGPRDNFDPATSHVIPALIRKIVDGDNPIVVWGDGSQTRSFLYADDFVDGLIATLERYAECDPVNVGTDEEVSIRNLVTLIAELAGSTSPITFDHTKPGGQPRRNGDFTKAARVCGFSAQVPLREGLAKTLAWYQSHVYAA